MPDLPFPTPTLGGKQLWADLFVCRGYRIQENVLSGHCRLLGTMDEALAFGSYAVCEASFARRAAQLDLAPRSDHLVITLHGLFRAKDAMLPMLRALHRHGFEAETVNYPSTRRTLEQHAEQLEHLLDRIDGVRTVSFVTHSMGGLVARVLLGRRGRWRQRMAVGRLVMIATPNQGAELVDLLGRLAAFRWLAGPGGSALDTARTPSLPIPDVPFGTITGVRGDGEGYNPLLPGDDDMTVSAASTRLAGAEDALTVRGVHTFIMRQPDVVQATIRYLKTGSFRG